MGLIVQLVQDRQQFICGDRIKFRNRYRGIYVLGNGCQWLTKLVGEARRHLPHNVHPRKVRKLAAKVLDLSVRVSALCDLIDQGCVRFAKFLIGAWKRVGCWDFALRDERCAHRKGPHWFQYIFGQSYTSHSGHKGYDCRDPDVAAAVILDPLNKVILGRENRNRPRKVDPRNWQQKRHEFVILIHKIGPQ